MKEKLEQLKESIASLDKKYRESRGYGEISDSPGQPEMEDMIYQYMRNVYNYVDSSLSYIWKWQDEHTKNHLPPILGAEKLQNALKILEIDKDYVVQPKTIFASNLKYIIKASRKNGIRLECDLIKG